MNTHPLYQPPITSHKGENGRLLVIGGSTLFHASIFWSADVASKIVDLVHFSSPAAENNELVRMKLKEGFWNGIVVPFEKIQEYISEDDVVLIGPGMPRDDGLMTGEASTEKIVNELVGANPTKRFVIDGGALQMIDPTLLNANMIVTPHHKEWERLIGHSSFRERVPEAVDANEMQQVRLVQQFSHAYGKVTILLKGSTDIVCQGDEFTLIEGGNPGMTKGGTGDVLAGLVAALYCKNEAFVAASMGSSIMKRAGERLAERVGVYFNASDLVREVPVTLFELHQ